MTAVVTGDKELDRFFRTLTPKLQRGAIRKGVRAAGSALVKESRRNLDRMATRRTGNLRKSLGQKAWSKPRQGIIGSVVGGRVFGKHKGFHAHLVEFGHEIVLHDGTQTGKRARPIPFFRTAMRTARRAIVEAQRQKLQQALRKQRAK